PGFAPLRFFRRNVYVSPASGACSTPHGPFSKSAAGLSAGISQNSSIRETAIAGDTVGWMSAAHAENPTAIAAAAARSARADIAAFLRHERNDFRPPARQRRTPERVVDLEDDPPALGTVAKVQPSDRRGAGVQADAC